MISTQRFLHEKVKRTYLIKPDEETQFWISHGKAASSHLRIFCKGDRRAVRHEYLDGDLRMFRRTVWDRVCAARIRSSRFYPNRMTEISSSRAWNPRYSVSVVESYTVGSAEFTLSFAAQHEGCMPLMDILDIIIRRVCFGQDSCHALFLPGVCASHYQRRAMGFGSCAALR